MTKTLKQLEEDLSNFAFNIIRSADGDEDEQEVSDNGWVLNAMIDKAIQTLQAMKNLYSKNQINESNDSVDLPEDFCCPISHQMMNDPVILVSGETYDRSFIQTWFDKGNRICPESQRFLSVSSLIPNKLVCKLISKWCNENNVDPPRPLEVDNAVVPPDTERARLASLLEKITSPTFSVQKEAAKEIRILTMEKPSFGSFLLESPENLPRLLTPLITTQRDELDKHPEFEEDLITCIYNLSIPDINKKKIAEHPHVLLLLVESLKRGALRTRINAAATLFTLSAIDSNTELIVKADALKPLIELLDEGDQLAMRDAAQTIFILCTIPENIERAVSDGAVEAMFRKINAGVLVDELLPILVLLSEEESAISRLAKVEVMKCLLGIIRDNTSQINKEHCCTIVLAVCLYNKAKLQEVWVEENAHGTITTLVELGNARASKKAERILKMLGKSKEPVDSE